MEPENPALDDYVRSLAPAREPRICLLPTAGGDSEDQIRRFHMAFGDQLCETSYISLFRLGTRPVPLREHLLAQDVIYVGGGSMVNLLALWRAHGLDEILREAWQAGIVLAGLSAGSMCWFEYGVTKSVGPPGRHARARLPARLELRPLRRRAGAAAGLPRGGRERRRPGRLGRRRRRRAALPRDAPGRGRGLAPERARLPRPRGRRRGRRGGDRAAAAQVPGAPRPDARRWRSRRCARCTRRGAGTGAADRARRGAQARGGAGRCSTSHRIATSTEHPPCDRRAQAAAATRRRDAARRRAGFGVTRPERNEPVADSSSAATSSGVPAAIR